MHTKEVKLNELESLIQCAHEASDALTCVQVLIARSLQKGKSIATVVKESSQGTSIGQGKASNAAGTKVKASQDPIPGSRLGSNKPGSNA